LKHILFNRIKDFAQIGSWMRILYFIYDLSILYLFMLFMPYSFRYIRQFGLEIRSFIGSKLRKTKNIKAEILPNVRKLERFF